MTGEETAILEQLLPPERRDRKDCRREEPLYAYGLLYLLLKREYGWSDWPVIAHTERGKPWFPEHPEVQFSLSHTAGAALAGVARGPIGVDIQKHRRVTPQLAQRIGTTEVPETFFAEWVRREAWGKYTGEGLAGNLESQLKLPDEATCCQPELFPGYAACAVTAGEIPEVTVLTPTEFFAALAE